ncbi:cucumber peeling cupredoxin [Dendrobium catenatum]|uniref:cucumber peeling cupredoxin n=1 Tax=Dendrobium catenatum TaxID=906689 RepID=UPI0010A08438|nr:cucumber peeling cupredoxin [Dendrobium catenatum]
MAQSHFLLFLLLGSLCALLLRVSYAHKDHVVGGGFGWKIPPNATFYKEWAATKTFVVGDKLGRFSSLFQFLRSIIIYIVPNKFVFAVFLYRTSAENVLEVSAQDYEDCGNGDIIEIYYRGPSTVQLSTPGRHFFYSGIGLHCEAGQKLAVNVVTTAPPPPFVADDSLYSIGGLEIFTSPEPSPLRATASASLADTRRYVAPAVAAALFGGYLLEELGM